MSKDFYKKNLCCNYSNYFPIECENPKDNFGCHVKDEDIPSYFIKQILKNFSLNAGFIIYKANKCSFIKSINISNVSIKNNLKIYEKIINDNKSLILNKRLYGLDYSVFIPVNFKNKSFLFAFFKNNEKFDFLSYKRILNEIKEFLKCYKKYNDLITTSNKIRISNGFKFNLNKILQNISTEDIFDSFLKTLNMSTYGLISCACYKDFRGNKDAKLISFSSKNKLVCINSSIKKEFLNTILDDNPCIKDYNFIFNDDKERFITSVKISLNEVLSYVFIFEFYKNFIYFNYKSLTSNILSYINILVDITANKQQEINFGKQVSLSYLSSGTIHYLNNFIQGISSRIELVKMYMSNDSKFNEQVSKIMSSLDDCKDFFSNYFLLINNQNDNVNEISFTDFIYDLFTKFEISYGDCLDLEIDNLDRKYYVKCNESYIFQALWNILVNAYEFSNPENVNIKINLQYFYKKNSNSGNFLKLTIDDIGRGMSEEVKMRAFEPFFSTKNIDKRTKISPSLHGLGLTISRGIITSIGGYIDIVSVENEGTRVKVVLPISS